MDSVLARLSDEDPMLKVVAAREGRYYSAFHCWLPAWLRKRYVPGKVTKGETPLFVFILQEAAEKFINIELTDGSRPEKSSGWGFSYEVWECEVKGVRLCDICLSFSSPFWHAEDDTYVRGWWRDYGGRDYRGKDGDIDALDLWRFGVPTPDGTAVADEVTLVKKVWPT